MEQFFPIHELGLSWMAARRAKSFDEADDLRSKMSDAGLEVRATALGATISVGANFDPSKLEALK